MVFRDIVIRVADTIAHLKLRSPLDARHEGPIGTGDNKEQTDAQVEVKSSFRFDDDIMTSPISTPIYENTSEKGSTIKGDVSRDASIKLDDSREARAYPWAILASTYLFQLTSLGYTVSFGVFQDFYVREFLTNCSPSAISWIGSTQAFLVLSLGLIAGPLFDRGYCYHLMISGCVINAFSLFMLSLARPGHYYEVFLAQAIGTGLGSSLVNLPSLAVLAQHCKDSRMKALAMPVAMAGTATGGVAYPILMNKLLHGTAGFARGTRIGAGFITGLQVLGLCFLFMKRSEQTSVELRSAEQDEPSRRDQVESFYKRTSALLARFARDRSYICFVIGLSLFEMAFIFPPFYLQLYAVKHGVDQNFSFYSISILNGASFLGRILAGVSSRFIRVENGLLLTSAGSTLVMFCFLAVQTAGGVGAFAAFYGLFSGGFIAITSPMLTVLSDGSEELGARMGVCYLFNGIGCLIGTPIAGALLNSNFIWWPSVVFSGLLYVLGSASFCACRIFLRKARKSQQVCA